MSDISAHTVNIHTHLRRDGFAISLRVWGKCRLMSAAHIHSEVHSSEIPPIPKATKYYHSVRETGSVVELKFSMCEFLILNPQHGTQSKTKQPTNQTKPTATSKYLKHYYKLYLPIYSSKNSLVLDKFVLPMTSFLNFILPSFLFLPSSSIPPSSSSSSVPFISFKKYLPSLSIYLCNLYECFALDVYIYLLEEVTGRCKIPRMQNLDIDGCEQAHECLKPNTSSLEEHQGPLISRHHSSPFSFLFFHTVPCYITQALNLRTF